MNIAENEDTSALKKIIGSDIGEIVPSEVSDIEEQIKVNEKPQVEKRLQEHNKAIAKDTYDPIANYRISKDDREGLFRDRPPFYVQDIIDKGREVHEFLKSYSDAMKNGGFLTTGQEMDSIFFDDNGQRVPFDENNPDHQEKFNQAGTELLERYRREKPESFQALKFYQNTPHKDEDDLTRYPVAHEATPHVSFLNRMKYKTLLDDEKDIAREVKRDYPHLLVRKASDGTLVKASGEPEWKYLDPPGFSYGKNKSVGSNFANTVEQYVPDVIESIPDIGKEVLGEIASGVAGVGAAASTLVKTRSPVAAALAALAAKASTSGAIGYSYEEIKDDLAKAAGMKRTQNRDTTFGIEHDKDAATSAYMDAAFGSLLGGSHVPEKLKDLLKIKGMGDNVVKTTLGEDGVFRESMEQGVTKDSTINAILNPIQEGALRASDRLRALIAGGGISSKDIKYMRENIDDIMQAEKDIKKGINVPRNMSREIRRKFTDRAIQTRDKIVKNMSEEADKAPGIPNSELDKYFRDKEAEKAAGLSRFLETRDPDNIMDDKIASSPWTKEEESFLEELYLSDPDFKKKVSEAAKNSVPEKRTVQQIFEMTDDEAYEKYGAYMLDPPKNMIDAPKGKPTHTMSPDMPALDYASNRMKIEKEMVSKEVADKKRLHDEATKRSEDRRGKQKKEYLGNQIVEETDDMVKEIESLLPQIAKDKHGHLKGKEYTENVYAKIKNKNYDNTRTAAKHAEANQKLTQSDRASFKIKAEADALVNKGVTQKYLNNVQSYAEFMGAIRDSGKKLKLWKDTLEKRATLPTSKQEEALKNLVSVAKSSDIDTKLKMIDSLAGELGKDNLSDKVTKLKSIMTFIGKDMPETMLPVAKSKEHAKNAGQLARGFGFSPEGQYGLQKALRKTVDRDASRAIRDYGTKGMNIWANMLLEELAND